MDDFAPFEGTAREASIRSVFAGVAPRYDLMNDAMSFGIHRLWKRQMAKRVRPQGGQVIIDLAGGTGDIAGLLASFDRSVIVADPSLPMMREGVIRGLGPVQWVGATAESLPFADETADTITMAFGLRNVTAMEVALKEILRVLKPGGRFLCLEFSTPRQPLKPIYDLYSALVIPRLGAWIAGQPSAYRYLIDSIRRFPNQEELKGLFEAIGLVNVTFVNQSFGIACLHEGEKPR